MPIQNIAGLSQLNSANGLSQKQQNSNSQNSLAKRNDTSLLKSDAIRNNALANISFTGQTKQFVKQNRDFRLDHSVYMYGKEFSDVEIDEKDIEHSIGQTVEKGEKGYNDQWEGSASVSVYYADPNERITKDIRKNHAYIVKYKPLPKEPLVEDMREVKDVERLSQMLDDLKVTQDIEEAKHKAREANRNAQYEREQSLEERGEKELKKSAVAKEKAKAKRAELEDKQEHISQLSEKLDAAYARYKEVTGEDFVPKEENLLTDKEREEKVVHQEASESYYTSPYHGWQRKDLAYRY